MGALGKGESIRVVDDEWANPTYVYDLARFILALCHSSFKGLVHFGGRDFLSRYDMVERICDVFGYDIGLVSPIASAEFAQPARRPLRAGLCNDRAEELSDVKPTGFDESLLEIQKTYSGN